MAETTPDTYHRHGEPDPKAWDEAEAVTGRKNDLGSVTPEAALPNSTLATRRKARTASTKAVESDEAENKSVKRSRTKK